METIYSPFHQLHFVLSLYFSFVSFHPVCNYPSSFLWLWTIKGREFMIMKQTSTQTNNNQQKNNHSSNISIIFVPRLVFLDPDRSLIFHSDLLYHFILVIVL